MITVSFWSGVKNFAKAASGQKWCENCQAWKPAVKRNGRIVNRYQVTKWRNVSTGTRAGQPQPPMNNGIYLDGELAGNLGSAYTHPTSYGDFNPTTPVPYQVAVQIERWDEHCPVCSTYLDTIDIRKELT